MANLLSTDSFVKNSNYMNTELVYQVQDKDFLKNSALWEIVCIFGQN